MEKLGLGPDICLERNPRLVYGRMTGWGQDGPLAKAAGHDLNFIALSGALHAMGHADRPPSPPLNLVGDYGGGAMMLLVGVLAALNERNHSGRGQVIDAAMSDGAAVLMSPFYSLLAQDKWQDERSANFLDGAAPFYGVYQCADARYISIGAIEPQFYRLLLQKCGIDLPDSVEQLDKDSWPAMRRQFERVILSRTRDEWCELLEGTDVCFAPVLSLKEAPLHAHNRARNTFSSADGIDQPAPAPRFSRTPSVASRSIAKVGEHAMVILSKAGLSPSEIAHAITEGGVHVSAPTASQVAG
jgi:alpha-methylacyl-CoA racemase